MNRFFIKGNKKSDNFWYNKLLDQIHTTNKILEQDEKLFKQMGRELHQISEEIEKMNREMDDDLLSYDFNRYYENRKKLYTEKMENAPNEESRKRWAYWLDKHIKEYPRRK